MPSLIYEGSRLKQGTNRRQRSVLVGQSERESQSDKMEMENDLTGIRRQQEQT